MRIEPDQSKAGPIVWYSFEVHFLYYHKKQNMFDSFEYIFEHVNVLLDKHIFCH